MNLAPHNRRRALRASRHARGMSLIEILVAVLLISFGLLGLVSLQAKSVQYSVGAEDSSRAALLANEVASAMWGANSTTLDAGVVAAWVLRVADPTVSGLPNGVGTVVVGLDNVARITVTWRAPTAPAGQQDSRYMTDVVIPAP
jgi:type IV pilus assembly protein PilV